MKFKLSKFLFI